MEKWQFPPIDLLDEPSVEDTKLQDTEKNSDIIIDVLKSHDIEVSINPDEIKVGPTFTQYPLEVKSPILISKIIELEKEITLAVASVSGTIRMKNPIPGTSKIGIEIPNNKRQMFYFKTAAEALREESNDSNILFPLGIDVESKIHTQDIKKLPHLMIGGNTGSGKSMLLHNIILSVLLNKTPDKVKLMLIDPKLVEFSIYEGIPHLINPVITDSREGADMLSWAVEEMERRYKLLSEAKVRTNKDYNDKIGKIELPDILIIVDEVEEIMIQDPALVEKSIIRLAQMAKNIGIHLIIANSRINIFTFTGLISANINSKAAFRTQNQIDSRVIIYQPGAEKLLGNGDMLFLPSDSMKPLRLQGSYISLKETERVVDFVKKQAQI